MDFFNRRSSSSSGKVQGDLIRNLHLAGQLVEEGNKKWADPARAAVVNKGAGGAALNVEQTTPKAVLGSIRSQRAKAAAESTPEAKAYAGDMAWRHEAVQEATDKAVAGLGSKRKVNRALKKYRKGLK